MYRNLLKTEKTCPWCGNYAVLCIERLHSYDYGWDDYSIPTPRGTSYKVRCSQYHCKISGTKTLEVPEHHSYEDETNAHVAVKKEIIGLWNNMYVHMWGKSVTLPKNAFCVHRELVKKKDITDRNGSQTMMFEIPLDRGLAKRFLTDISIMINNDTDLIEEKTWDSKKYTYVKNRKDFFVYPIIFNLNEGLISHKNVKITALYQEGDMLYIKFENDGAYERYQNNHDSAWLKSKPEYAPWIDKLMEKMQEPIEEEDEE